MNYIQKLIEARVGYKFKLEELPPHLRKKYGTWNMNMLLFRARSVYTSIIKVMWKMVFKNA